VVVLNKQVLQQKHYECKALADRVYSLGGRFIDTTPNAFDVPATICVVNFDG